MSRANIELIQQLYGAFARRDVPVIFSFLAPEVEVAQTPELPWGGAFKGRDEFGQFFGGLTRHIESNLEFDHFLDAGDHVVAIGRTRGKVNANGQLFDMPAVHVWQLRDGQVVRFQPYIDVPTMQASLSAESAESD
jgi:ketosteroid isomerase-like protein